MITHTNSQDSHTQMDIRFDLERKAQVIVEAVTLGNKAASQRNSLSERTVRRYIREVEKNPELSRIVQTKKRLVEENWVAQIDGAILAGINYLERSSLELPVTPEGTHAVAGAIKLLSEVKIRHQLVDIRIALLQKKASAQA